MDPKVVDACRALLADGESVDDLVVALRAWGQSKIGSIRVLLQVTNLSLGDLKRLVHHSPAWADRLAEDDQFHAALHDAANRRTERD